MDGIDSRKHSGTTSKFANSNGYSSFWFCYIVVIPSAHTSTIPEPVPQVWDEYSIPSYTYQQTADGRNPAPPEIDETILSTNMIFLYILQFSKCRIGYQQTAFSPAIPTPPRQPGEGRPVGKVAAFGKAVLGKGRGAGRGKGGKGGGKAGGKAGGGRGLGAADMFPKNEGN